MRGHIWDSSDWVDLCYQATESISGEAQAGDVGGRHEADCRLTGVESEVRTGHQAETTSRQMGIERQDLGVKPRDTEHSFQWGVMVKRRLFV